jgi:HEAT repeat protein
VRTEAARTLGILGPDARAAVPALTQLLEETDQQLRQGKTGRAAQRSQRQEAPAPDRMVYTLGQAEGKRLWPAQVHELERCRLEAACALVRIDPRQGATAVPTIRSSLKSRDTRVVLDAALTLAQADPMDKEALETLLHQYAGPGMEAVWNPVGIRESDSMLQRLSRLSPAAQETLRAVATPLLTSPDVRLRHAAALALAKLDLEKALPVLREMIKTGSTDEILAVVQFLSELGAKGKLAFADLCQVMQRKKADRSGWGSDFDHGRIALALTQIDPEAAVPFLLKMWREDRPSPMVDFTLPADGKEFNPFKDLLASQVSQHARDALMALGPKAAAAIPGALADLKSNDDWLHEPATQLLAKIGPAAVPSLLELTNDKEAIHRARAARVLGRIGAEAKPAVPVLLKLLEDQETVVRQEASTALGSIDSKDKAVASALIRAAKDPEARVRRHAVRTLGGVGADALPALEAALADADADVCRGAAGQLGRIGAPAVALLRAALRHKETDVRRLAVLGLGAIDPETEGVVAGLSQAAKDKDRLVRRLALSLMDRRSKAVIPVLATGLRDSDRQVRWTAAFVLEELGADAAAAAPALAQVLEDPRQEVRHQAVRALRDIGPAARTAVPALKQLLIGARPPGIVEVGNTNLPADVVEALVRLDPDPVPMLIEAMSMRDTPAGQAAAGGLVRLGPKAVPALLKVTRTGKLSARLGAIACLGGIGKPVETVVPVLEKFLKDTNDLIRAAAAAALGDIGPPSKSALPLLRSMAEEKDQNIQRAARQALERIDR